MSEEEKDDGSNADEHQAEGERAVEQSDESASDERADESDMDEITVDSAEQKGGDSPIEEGKKAPPFEAVNPKSRLRAHKYEKYH